MNLLLFYHRNSSSSSSCSLIRFHRLRHVNRTNTLFFYVKFLSRDKLFINSNRSQAIPVRCIIYILEIEMREDSENPYNCIYILSIFSTYNFFSSERDSSRLTYFTVISLFSLVFSQSLTLARRTECQTTRHEHDAFEYWGSNKQTRAERVTFRSTTTDYVACRDSIIRPNYTRSTNSNIIPDESLQVNVCNCVMHPPLLIHRAKLNSIDRS